MGATANGKSPNLMGVEFTTLHDQPMDQYLVDVEKVESA